MDNTSIGARRRLEKSTRDAMDSEEREYIRKRKSILKELRYRKCVKQTGESEDNLRQMLVALERQYRFDRERHLRCLRRLEFVKSPEEKLQDIRLPFRWFAKMVLGVGRVLSRHSVMTGVVFIALVLGLCIWAVPWIKAVFHHQETMCTSSYWAMLGSIPICCFFFIPWINGVCGKTTSFSVLVLGFFVPLIAYALLFLIWVVAMVIIMGYTGCGYFLLAFGVGCCSAFGAAYMLRKFDAYEYGFCD